MPHKHTKPNQMSGSCQANFGGHLFPYLHVGTCLSLPPLFLFSRRYHFMPHNNRKLCVFMGKLFSSGWSSSTSPSYSHTTTRKSCLLACLHCKGQDRTFLTVAKQTERRKGARQFHLYCDYYLDGFLSGQKSRENGIRFPNVACQDRWNPSS